MKLREMMAALGALGAPATGDRQYWYDLSGNVSAVETFDVQQTRLDNRYVQHNGTLTAMRKVTQAEYDALTPLPTTLYVIVG